MKVKPWITRFGVLFVGWLVAYSTLAQAQEQSSEVVEQPHEVVEQLTDSMMEIIKGGDQLLQENPDDYYREIREVLEPTVSFGFIARNVMGGYWEETNKAQRDEFVETFTRSMVETLGKGMASYSELKIETKAAKDIGDARRVEIVQEITGRDGTNRVSYTMAKNRSAEWKLVNVVLNGVNLGKSFRDQFAQAMRQNENNVDEVINSWANNASV